MDISSLIKLLFVVTLSESSGILAHIYRNNNVIVLYFMVRVLCQKTIGVKSSSYHIMYFSKDISFFSYVILLNTYTTVDYLTEYQSSDLDLNKLRKLCCTWAPQWHNTMNPIFPIFPNNVSTSNSRFQIAFPEASTRKRVWRRRWYEKIRSGVGRGRIRIGIRRIRRTTILMVGMIGIIIRIRSGKFDEFDGRCHGG